MRSAQAPHPAAAAVKAKGIFCVQIYIGGVESAPHVVSVRGPLLRSRTKPRGTTRHASPVTRSVQLSNRTASTAEQLSICSCCNRGYLARDDVSPIWLVVYLYTRQSIARRNSHVQPDRHPRTNSFAHFSSARILPSSIIYLFFSLTRFDPRWWSFVSFWLSVYKISRRRRRRFHHSSLSRLTV